jgi:hypothetical protein
MRGMVKVRVAFRIGHAQGGLLDRVAQVADLEFLGGRQYRATFHLSPDGRGFGTVATLIDHTAGKRSTSIEVDGYREMGLIVKNMAQCAGPYAYSIGHCGFPFQKAVPARCRACPLFDAQEAEDRIAASYEARGGRSG